MKVKLSERRAKGKRLRGQLKNVKSKPYHLLKDVGRSRVDVNYV